MGVERNGSAARTIVAAHDQVGDALQAGGLHFGGGYRVLFSIQLHGGKQFSRALGVGRIVARWRVGGHADQFLQESDLFVKVGVYPGVELGVRGHSVGLASGWWNGSLVSNGPQNRGQSPIRTSGCG